MLDHTWEEDTQAGSMSGYTFAPDWTDEGRKYLSGALIPGPCEQLPQVPAAPN